MKSNLLIIASLLLVLSLSAMLYACGANEDGTGGAAQTKTEGITEASPSDTEDKTYAASSSGADVEGEIIGAETGGTGSGDVTGTSSNTDGEKGNKSGKTGETDKPSTSATASAQTDKPGKKKSTSAGKITPKETTRTTEKVTERETATEAMSAPSTHEVTTAAKTEKPTAKTAKPGAIELPIVPIGY